MVEGVERDLASRFALGSTANLRGRRIRMAVKCECSRFEVAKSLPQRGTGYKTSRHPVGG